MIEVSSSVAFALHLLCACSLSVAFWITRVVYVSSLISNPVQTLRLLWVIQSPIVILGFSLVRQNPQHCSYLKAVGRGLLGLLAGALLNAFGAIVLGAPIGIELSLQPLFLGHHGRIDNV
ncbi:uncharacterized protein LOC143887506 isoform X3 [Tasmannia lanceolata]|uniref:uncharacterized protein LOC143887506 isoform X3 n=1 Tax=Tasmannia lanceolata TaxID=3420 RepID=UPI0040647307